MIIEPTKIVTKSIPAMIGTVKIKDTKKDVVHRKTVNNVVIYYYNIHYFVNDVISQTYSYHFQYIR